MSFRWMLRPREARWLLRQGGLADHSGRRIYVGHRHRIRNLEKGRRIRKGGISNARCGSAGLTIGRQYFDYFVDKMVKRLIDIDNDSVFVDFRRFEIAKLTIQK